MAHLQSLTALAQSVLIHEAHTAHIGDHPAIPEGGIQCGNQILGESAQQQTPHLDPFKEVNGSALQTLPFTADSGHGTLAIQVAQMLFAVLEQVNPLVPAHGLDGFELTNQTAAVILDIVKLLLAEGFPIGFLEHIDDNAADFLQVFALCLPIHIGFGTEEFGVGIFALTHYLTPPFFWMRLISRDSTNAWKRVRSWPEPRLLYRRSILSTGQPFSSAITWLTRARSKPQKSQYFICS